MKWGVGQAPCSWIVFEEEGIIEIETPRAFMEYGRIHARSWKAVQAGVQKLRLHQLNEAGSPFLVKDGQTVMRLNVTDYKDRRVG